MAYTKEQLHEQVLARKDELIALCQDLVRIKNQSPIDDQAPALDFVQRYLAEAGIASERIVADAGEAYPVVFAQMGDASAEGSFRVVLNGHVDVVPVGQRSGWDFDPFGAEIRDGKIFTELRRGGSTRQAFFERIMEVVAMMGGEGSDAL